uniref:uncharacterized protein LOC120344703 n=1 Tax=Styela clava TaxID=7725 RepID=UPI00193ACB53|nr:uncharacterized protein LOC120344703 [Styela clava]
MKTTASILMVLLFVIGSLGNEASCPAEPNGACTMMYDPVCGNYKGSYQTFGNLCVYCNAIYDAGLLESEDFRSGQCIMTGCPFEPKGCNRMYDPVCGLLNGSYHTFNNLCTYCQALGQSHTLAQYHYTEGECNMIQRLIKNGELEGK